MDKLNEAIALEADLLLKLRALPETEIFDFMQNLRGGTYFNMGMYSAIPVAKAYKATIRIYKVVDLAAIVSGVSYENIGTTKDFRDKTGEAPGHAWYDHMPGFENKVGVKKSDPNSKYVLWDIKQCTDTCVRYYVVDIATGAVNPVTKEDVLQSSYLTQTEKNKLMPRPVTGFDLTTGNLVENKTVWRTASFDHIFWLSQAGKGTKEYGTRFAEALKLSEAIGTELFRDANAHVSTSLDDILSGGIVENCEESDKKPEVTDESNTPDTQEPEQEKLEEATLDLFVDGNASVATKALDDVLAGTITEAMQDTVVFVDLSGSSDVHKETLTKAAVADGHAANSIKYFSDALFTEVVEAANQGLKVFLYTKDDDYVYNCPELGEMSNVTIKLIETTGLQESYRRTVSRGNILVDNDLFVDFE